MTSKLQRPFTLHAQPQSLLSKDQAKFTGQDVANKAVCAQKVQWALVLAKKVILATEVEVGENLLAGSKGCVGKEKNLLKRTYHLSYFTIQMDPVQTL
ncbi:hypothetical protein H4Q26_001475 [Puccinia striiformis f. sp. tritici PST-130]|nr:hypothetical protein H4Q26_001475 [Puccinia striiformis f. sp. tritici PST-130]